MSEFFRKLSIHLPMRPRASLKMMMLALFVLIGNLSVISGVYAGSCAYQEAMMAMDKGNAVRGLALMRMAGRDGDLRAERYLREQDNAAGLPVLVKGQRSLTLATTARY